MLFVLVLFLYIDSDSVIIIIQCILTYSIHNCAIISPKRLNVGITTVFQLEQHY